MTSVELRSTLPRKRVTAGVLVRDAAGRVLLLEPTYRPDRLTPGGSVEADEPPRAAAAREALEELGVPLPVERLLVVHWELEADDPDGVLHFLYDGGVVDAAVTRRFELEPGIAAWGFVDPADLADLMPAPAAERLRAGLEALAGDRPIELPR